MKIKAVITRSDSFLTIFFVSCPRPFFTWGGKRNFLFFFGEHLPETQNFH